LVNNLKKLPNSMDTLYCLQHLSISGNNIEEMPPLIGKYTVWDDLLDDYSIQFPDEMTDKCGQ
jgi:Leucine-rich repeat (LRR) protein